jgi:DNA-binding response OmpR family regulator
MLRRIFLVDSDPQCAAELARSLVHAQYSVSVVSSFEDACALEAGPRPDLLITSVRLGRFNGLHVAARFRADYSELPIVVLGEDREMALASETLQLQVRLVPKSLPGPEFLQYIDDLIRGRNPKDLVSTRRWPRHVCDFPAGLLNGTARVTDVGYGGLRLQCNIQPAAEVRVEIRMDTMNMSVNGICRWSIRVDDQTWTCGFELDASTTDAGEWRQFVDSGQVLTA